MENMKYKTYEEIVSFVGKDASEKELKRIREEDELFINRKWEKYVLFLVNTLSNRSGIDSSFRPEWGGSALNSLIIQKAIGFGIWGDEYEPFVEKNKNIRFNDALRLVLRVHSGFIREQNVIERINQFEESLAEYGFNHVNGIVNNKFYTKHGRHNDKSEVYIISENRITDECIAAVKNENANESEDEKSLLRKCLLVYMTVFSGL